MVAAEIQAKVDEWMSQDPNPETRKEIEDLVAAGNETELRRRMMKRIAFGTAGLRGRMQAGYAHMNQLTVIQASQGLVMYLESQFGEDAKKRGVAIAFDGRYNSKTFAHLAAAAFLSRGHKVYLFKEMAVTPMVPFCVKKKGCVAGIVVTASHNPKADNGYKVYWDNSAQIIPPHDAGIAKAIEENLKPWGSDIKLAETSELCEDPSALIDEYMKEVADRYCNTREANKASKHKMVYTAMHGVGAKFITKVFEAFDLPTYIPVPEQINPDPEFPTVELPNPEEGRGALELATKTAAANGAKVILASDPDADRLAVAELQEDGSWRIFSGNELGALIGNWVWAQHLRRNPGFDKSKGLMVASTVSSKFLKGMAEKEGFHFDEALTGFKWIGNRGASLAKENGWELLFGFEEAIGFMLPIALDKDGVSAAALFAELYIDLANQNIRLSEQLINLYKKYGFYKSCVSYHRVPGDDVAGTMATIFNRLRNWDGKPNNYPTAVGEYEIASVRDLETGYDSSKPDNKATMPKSAFMITFTFKNGCVATFRGSGTEPKLKHYIEVFHKDDEKAAKTLLDDMVEKLIAAFVEPEKYNLQRAAM